tara:strand:- start:235 stop:510 length:276 start_codon:yes stop_codon:yes gene_type:complete
MSNIRKWIIDSGSVDKINSALTSRTDLQISFVATSSCVGPVKYKIDNIEYTIEIPDNCVYYTYDIHDTDEMPSIHKLVSSASVFYRDLPNP